MFLFRGVAESSIPPEGPLKPASRKWGGLWYNGAFLESLFCWSAQPQLFARKWLP
jgi:hypothetical protein